MVHAMVIFKRDYGSALYMELLLKAVQKLQKVQNDYVWNIKI